MKTKSKGKIYDAYFPNSWATNYLIDKALLLLGCSFLMKGYEKDYYNLVVFVPNQEGLNYLQRNATFVCQFPASDEDLKTIMNL